MAYRLPTFNLSINRWRVPTNVTVDPPDDSPVGNLSPGKRTIEIFNPNSSLTAPNRYISKQVSELLLPAGTDILPSDYYIPGPTDMVEVPAGSGRFYVVWCVEDVAKGFGNEYRLALIQQADLAFGTYLTALFHNPPWPSPMP